MLIACKSCSHQYEVDGLAPGAKVHCRCGELIVVPDQKNIHDAKMVHCSSCGAHLKEGDSECGYCQSAVGIAEHQLGQACPNCLARLQKNANFCCECGITIDAEKIVSAPVSEECPRCDGKMVLRQLQKGSLSECTACGGIWLSEKMFQDVVESREERTAADVMVHSSAQANKEQASLENINTVKYIQCPECSEFMHRKNFAGCSGVVIDWCKGHGYWFDTFELSQIFDFVKAGGIQKSRERDARIEASSEKRKGSRMTAFPEQELYDSSTSAFGGHYSRKTDILEFLVEGVMKFFMR